jgi:hypothetical protein
MIAQRPQRPQRPLGEVCPPGDDVAADVNTALSLLPRAVTA